MKQTMKKLLYILLPAILFASCEDVIDVELNEEDMDLYAVEAKITTISEPYVILTKGLPVTVDAEFEGISGAVVTITDDAVPANTITLAEDPEKAGFYSTPSGLSYPGVKGRTYTVQIVTEGVTLTAMDVLSPVEKIDSIKIYPSLRGDRQFLGIFTFGRETPGKGNYYKWDIYINDTLLNDAATMMVVNDDLVDGNYVNGLEIFTDFHDPRSPQDRIISYLDTIRVEQNSISEFAYYYYLQLINQSVTGTPFSVPPANVISNFTSSDGKDVLGLFTAHDVSVSNIAIVDDIIENQLAR